MNEETNSLLVMERKKAIWNSIQSHSKDPELVANHLISQS